MSRYLTELDAAPDREKFKLVRQWIDAEPLPFFRALRDARPVLVTPEATLVTRLDDCVEVLNQPRIFTVRLYEPKMDRYLMSHDDDSFHTREKSLMQAFLNRDDLPRVRALVGRYAEQILDHSSGKIELINAYCRMVPATLVQEYFGLDGVDERKLIEWSYWNQADTFYNQPFDIYHSADDRERISTRHKETGQELAAYIARLMARKVLTVRLDRLRRSVLLPWRALARLWRRERDRDPPQSSDDIVSRMIRSTMAQEVDVDLTRVGINAGGLLIGAIETTSQAVAQAIAYLLAHPQQFQAAKGAAARLPVDEFDGFVWEALRFVPISPYLFRVAATDVMIARGTERETAIAAGTNVLAITQSAMFDPQAFSDPESFQPGRNWYHQFHFGYGVHACLGRYIGAEMIPEMVRRLVLREGLTQQGPIDYQGGHLPQTYHVAYDA